MGRVRCLALRLRAAPPRAGAGARFDPRAGRHRLCGRGGRQGPQHGARADAGQGKGLALDHVHGVHLTEVPREIDPPSAGVVYVYVELQVDGGDETFTGQKDWGYFLRAGGPAGWQITDEGVG